MRNKREQKGKEDKPATFLTLFCSSLMLESSVLSVKKLLKARSFGEGVCVQCISENVRPSYFISSQVTEPWVCDFGIHPNRCKQIHMLSTFCGENASLNN